MDEMADLTLNEFQNQCETTAIYRNKLKSRNERLNYCVLGLTSEAGEVAGKLKKVMRDQDGYVDMHAAMAMCDEVGDVLWYCFMTLYELGITGDMAAAMTLKKLSYRAERGVLGGSGDKR